MSAAAASGAPWPGTSTSARRSPLADPADPRTPPGVHPLPDGSGADVAVHAAHADAVEVCLLEPDGEGGWREQRWRLPERTHGRWHGRVPGLGHGARYGLRVHGPWEPWRGHRHNPAKLLLDPYARGVTGRLTYAPEAFGHVVDASLRGVGLPEPDGRDSAAHVPHAVVPHAWADGGFDWSGDERPATRWGDSVVYEAHVRGMSARHPAVPEHLRGTYAGMAHPAVLEHLVGLGVTAVELLPVHAGLPEQHLAQRGMANYWGYNTIGFLAPDTRLASTRDPSGALAELKGMVKALHQAGLQVLLDVVYNHTAEAGVDGPTVSFRGLDAATYYRLDDLGRDVDTTGCGNSLDFREPVVVQLALDSLRYWARECHVDGFRFDLAPTLARGRDGFDPDHPFLVAARADPVVGRTVLIAEPWDIGPHGWRTGQFPPPFAEWNDRFRDGVRTFWLADAARVAAGGTGSGVRELATRIAGSADTFASSRGPQAGVSFVTAHDGFTLADLTAYEQKHNEANGEDNRDGHGDNRSWNHGVEGPTDDDVVLAARRRSARNLLGTLLVSAGVPMLTMGDEIGRTQGGNNNAYCHDGPMTWVDWQLDAGRRDLLATTSALLRLRAEHPVLRQRSFFAGRPSHDDGTTDLAWFGADGAEMDDAAWHDPSTRVLQVLLHGAAVDDDSLLVVVQGRAEPADVVLPGPPWASAFEVLWDSSPERPSGSAVPPRVRGGSPVRVAAMSMQVLRVVR